MKTMYCHKCGNFLGSVYRFMTITPPRYCDKCGSMIPKDNPYTTIERYPGYIGPSQLRDLCLTGLTPFRKSKPQHHKLRELRPDKNIYTDIFHKRMEKRIYGKPKKRKGRKHK